MMARACSWLMRGSLTPMSRLMSKNFTPRM
jgi:hypothetical protein